MLPDYPQFKGKLSELYIERLKNVKKKLMVTFGDVPLNKMFEGHKSVLIREDGTRDEIEFKSIRANIEINLKDIDKLTLSDVIKKIDSMAEEMARQESIYAFAEIEKSVEKIGNVVDARGKGLTPTIFFEMLDKIWIEFDENNNPILPQIVTGKDLFESSKKLFEELESNPGHKKRLDEVIEKKRREWLDREGNRTLVG